MTYILTSLVKISMCINCNVSHTISQQTSRFSSQYRWLTTPRSSTAIYGQKVLKWGHLFTAERHIMPNKLIPGKLNMANPLSLASYNCTGFGPGRQNIALSSPLARYSTGFVTTADSQISDFRITIWLQAKKFSHTMYLFIVRDCKSFSTK